MPTIEIISIGASELRLDQNDFEIAFIEENKLISHRGLFNDYLNKQWGVIIHLGNPDLKHNKSDGFFAGLIIDWDYIGYDMKGTGLKINSRFKFLPKYQNEIAKIISIGFQKSPTKKTYFLTDYQFGPDNYYIREMNLNSFWKQYDDQGLEWNVLYELTE